MSFGLDLKAGCDLALAEMYGDWYRDPWGWPEFTWLSQKPDRFDLASCVRKEGGEHILAIQPAFHIFEVPKSRVAFRPAVVQDSLSRLAYASAVASNMGRLHVDLPDWAFGWRHRPDVGRARNSDEWRHYLGRTDNWWFGDEYALQVDIGSFFASVDVDRIADLLYQKLGKQVAVAVISQVLRAHDGLATRSGIPQRSFASAALANIYLRPIDDALETATKAGASGVVRWMDDITAIGPEDKMYSLFLDLRDRARQIGLALNDSKTRLGSATDAAASIYMEGLRTIHVPSRSLGADYTGEEVVELDTAKLLDLEERILATPGQFSRTHLRAVLTTLRQCREWTRWREWLAVAHELPHVADSLGRFFREVVASDNDLLGSGRKNLDDLNDWFADYCRREWSKVTWATSQFALMFPTNPGNESQVEVWTNWLENSDRVQMVAIAGQRLAAIDPSRCRDIICGRIDGVMDPILLRVFALALLASGGERRTVRSILDRDERNLLVRLVLEDRNWSPPSAVADFDGDRTDSDE